MTCIPTYGGASSASSGSRLQCAGFAAGIGKPTGHCIEQSDKAPCLSQSWVAWRVSFIFTLCCPDISTHLVDGAACAVVWAHTITVSESLPVQFEIVELQMAVAPLGPLFI